MKDSTLKKFGFLAVIYALFLLGLSLIITSWIASEEAEFLTGVFDKWAVEKAWILAALNAVVPIALAGLYESSKIRSFLFYKLPVFGLGLVVLSSASYQTVDKYLDDITSSQWSESRIIEIDKQLATNQGYLLEFKGQKVNTAKTIHKIQLLQDERLKLQTNPNMQKAEAFFIVGLLTAARIILWILAIGMSRKAMEIIRQYKESSNSSSSLSGADLTAFKLEISELKELNKNLLKKNEEKLNQLNDWLLEQHEMIEELEVDPQETPDFQDMMMDLKDKMAALREEKINTLNLGEKLKELERKNKRLKIELNKPIKLGEEVERLIEETEILEPILGAEKNGEKKELSAPQISTLRKNTVQFVKALEGFNARGSKKKVKKSA